MKKRKPAKVLLLMKVTVLDKSFKHINVPDLCSIFHSYVEGNNIITTNS